MKPISTYLILGKNDRVAAEAARGVGAPVIVDMIMEKYVFAFVNVSTILNLVISWIVTGQKCENVV